MENARPAANGTGVEQVGLTKDILAALDVARALVKGGVPVFVAPPHIEDGECVPWCNPRARVTAGFHLPARWHTSMPTLDVVDRWRPGWALCAVMGHTLDLVDVDPRNGGDASASGMKAAGVWPRSYGRAATPSGGYHDFIAPLGAGSHDNIADGIDVKGGRPDGTSRGFAFIAPTVRISKTTGQVEPYRWIVEPDVEGASEGDDSGEHLAQLVRGASERPATAATPSDPFDAVWPAGPWDDILAAVAGGRHKGVYRLACALRGRGGWQFADGLRYMQAVVWPLIDQQQGGHPYPFEEFEATIRDAFHRHADGPSSEPPNAPGESHSGLVSGSFEWLVDRKLTELRATERARELLRIEQQAALEVPTFDAGLLDEILARPAEPPHRIEGLLPSQGRLLLVAQRKTGKTTWMLNLARDLITGGMFLDRFEVRPITGRVAILNYEVTGAQLATWAKEAGLPLDRLLLVNLRGRRNPLSYDQDREQLATMLRRHQVEVLMVDPFGRAYDGKSQNDPGEVTSWLVRLDQFADQCGVSEMVLAAHAGWDGERTRGASSLEDWGDSIVTLARPKLDEDQRFMRAMGRDVDVDEDALTFDRATRRLSMAGTGSRKAVDTARKLAELSAVVVDVVTKRPGLNVVQVAQALKDAGVGFRTHEESRALQKAVSDGRLRVETKGRSRFHYPAGSIPPNPPDSLPGSDVASLPTLSMEGRDATGGNQPSVPPAPRQCGDSHPFSDDPTRCPRCSGPVWLGSGNCRRGCQ